MRFIFKDQELDISLAGMPEWHSEGSSVLAPWSRELKDMVAPFFEKAGISEISALFPILELAYIDGSIDDEIALQQARSILLLENLLAVADAEVGWAGVHAIPQSDFRGYLEKIYSQVFAKESEKIRRVFFEDLDDGEEVFGEIEKLFCDRRYEEAKLELEKLKEETLPSAGLRMRFDRVAFRLELKTQIAPDVHRSHFEELDKKYRNSGDFRAMLWMDYARHLDDVRDHSAAGKIIRDFDRTFPLWLVGGIERATYLHIKGRILYHRGKFNEALDALSESAEIAQGNDALLFAAACNTAVNCFGDNLYYSAAGILADTAFAIREQFGDAQAMETQSLLGQLAFRQSYFHEAMRMLSLVEQDVRKRMSGSRELGRILNYRAKVLIANGDRDEANALLEQAENLELEPKPKSFTRLYRLLWMTKWADIGQARNYYRQYFSAEEEVDLFCLGWASAFIADKLAVDFSIDSDQQSLEEAQDACRKSIQAFHKDNYFIEPILGALLPFARVLSESVEAEFRAVLSEERPFEKLRDYMDRHTDLQEAYFACVFAENPPEYNDTLETFFLRVSSAFSETDVAARTAVIQRILETHHLY